MTRINVLYPARRGTVALRGNLPPLSWTGSVALGRDGENRWFLELDLPEGELLEFKVVRQDGAWSAARNYTVMAGETTLVMPSFEHPRGRIETQRMPLEARRLGRSITYEVFLPPSYDEHDEKRYPVLYVQDGHALFTHGEFEGDSWLMDLTMNNLYELGVLEEIIVIGIHTRDRRLELLSPCADPVHGGGAGELYLQFLVETLKPAVDARYRTLPGNKHTALLGSSMGGLFSFHAAWTRPDVFGRAACLSSSFWWNDRWMIRQVQKGVCPVPRPWIYLDSGAARWALEHDANLRDGLHHTAAMAQALVTHCYLPGDNIHSLAFAGLAHDNASWAARLAIPLQLLFPRKT